VTIESKEYPTPLQATLSYVVANIPYYRSAVRSLDANLALSDFPVINGQTIADRLHDFYHLSTVPDFLLTSGGTSGSATKIIVLDYREMDAGFCARMGLPSLDLEYEQRLDPEAFAGLALILIDNQHGFVLPPGHGRPVVMLPLEVGRHFELVVRVLKEGFIVGGRRLPIVQLFASITKLRVLTDYCEARGISVEAFSIERIVSLAFFASAKAKERLSRYWQAKVTDAYGLTEFLGTVSLRCEDCGGFHLPASVHSEFLSLDQGRPIEAGAAELVLTTLLPYRVAMPLVRYATGDVIDVLPWCPSARAAGFTLCGRRGTVICTSSRPYRVLLSAFEVIDALEQIDSEHGHIVAYDEQVPTVMSWGLAAPVPNFGRSGYAQLSCSISENRMEIFVEVDAHLSAAIDFRECLADALNTLIKKRAAEWIVEPALVEVTIVPRGGISQAGRRINII
jgi:hypothetical protein